MRIIGADIGTMNIVTSVMTNDEKMQFKSIRNMFLPISNDVLEINELTNSQLDYVIQKDDNDEDKIFIMGEDAFKFSQIFGNEIKRPMTKGVISTGELDAIDVLTTMLDKLVGKVEVGTATYSVPAQSVDIETPPVLYHQKVFNKIFKALGYKGRPINEALAIIYSECRSTNFTGIAISFGAGLTNVCCAYKGQPMLSFAVSRGGDWIDENAANSIGAVTSRITNIKERDLDLLDSGNSKKKEKRVKEAITFYYEDLIEYVLNVFCQEFDKNADGFDIDQELPIVVSGGTSKPKNFVELFKTVFDDMDDFPYDVSEIRHASDPLKAVAKGCLIHGLWENSKK
jgi:hypothetical protein